MSQLVRVGIPQQVDLEVQQAADETQGIQLFAGKDILASWEGAGSVIGLTVTDHGLTTGATVIVRDHALNVNANGTWVITVLDANRYTLTGSTWLTNGSTTGQAGAPTDLTGYTFIAKCKSSIGGSLMFTFSATPTGTPTDGKVNLVFVAATTNAATVGKYVWDLKGVKSGADKFFARGSLTLTGFISS